jgi:hypothetical protein
MPGRLSTSNRFLPIDVCCVDFVTGAHRDDSSQLFGGGGPAGNLRPSPSMRLLARGREVGVSGRSRSCLISEGILGVMTGAVRCPSEEILEDRRAWRSSVTLGESSLPSRAVSYGRPKPRTGIATYDSESRNW